MSHRQSSYVPKSRVEPKKINKNNLGIPITTTEKRSQHKNATTKKTPKSKKKRPPFIPPPGKTSPGRKGCSWESKSHRLEINPPLSKSRSLHINDLSSTEDSDDNELSNRYERKIDKLLQDVSLTEREYVRSKSEEQLNASRRLIEDQEDEIEAYKKNLNETARDYKNLRKSYSVLNKEVELAKGEAELLGNEKDKLIKKLVDIEMEGQAAISEVAKLRETCKLLKHDKKLTSAEFSNLTYQRDALLEKLEDFERSNKVLRKLLKEAHKREEFDRENADRCEILMQKLTRCEAKCQKLNSEISEKDSKIETLLAQIDADKHQARTYEDLHKTMEGTRAHLQNELRQRESENNRLVVQLKKLESELNSQALEVEHYQGLLAATRDKSIKDKDALKKATRIQRERAMKQEDANSELNRQVSDLIAESETMKVAVTQLNDAKMQLLQDKEYLEEEIKTLRKNIFEIANIMELSSKTVKAGACHVSEKLISKIRQLKTVKLENQSLKDEVKTLEENLTSSERSSSNKIYAYESELAQLQSAVQQYEGLTKEYKTQLEKYRAENEDLKDRLRLKDSDTHRKVQDSMKEVQEVRSSLQSKILELEPYPELLRTSEIRLQDAQARIDVAEKRASEHARLIAELTQKVEFQMEQLDRLQNKYRDKSDECSSLEKLHHSVERKIRENEMSHRELILSMNHKDETIDKLKEQLQTQAVENERLIQQLEVALSDAKKQADVQKEKTIAKERTAQARIMDLEAQLSRSTQNTQMLKRSKDEAERKFNSRLQDMRDRLEQANNTTRSMQSYVQFLKTTYANVFTDDMSN